MPLTRSLRSLLLGLSLLHAACEQHTQRSADGSEDPSAVAAPGDDQRVGNKQGPIASTLRGPSRVVPGETAELRLEIDRRALHQHVPVEVQLVLPADVVLEQGAEHTAISPGGEPSLQLRYVVRPLVRPREPLKLVIDARGEGFGYHAELPFYFEGHAQPDPGPTRTAGEVRIGRRNFGQSVAVGLTSD